MKTHPKYIMGPLIFGGLILSVFLTLLIYHIRSADKPEKETKSPINAKHLLKVDGVIYPASVIRKIFSGN